MTSTLAFSEIDSIEHQSIESQFKPVPSKGIKPELTLLNDEAEDNALFSDFVAPPKPLSAKALYADSKSSINSDSPPKIIESLQDRPVTQSTYQKINTNQSENYYKQYIPPYNSTTTQDTGDLSKKINYMIHILEEQQDIKHGSVTEELVLYCFLGVFIIYVVDSFAKVGKYVR
jgi:hypothetical protein